VRADSLRPFLKGRGDFYRTVNAKNPGHRPGFFTCLMPGSSLLSHGETPHYHRRYGVSLLSSAWGQVGPPRCRRQANSLCSVLCLLRCCCVGRARKVSHIPLYAPSFSSLAALLQRKILRTSSHHRTKLKIISHHQNIFGVVRLSLSGH
jgi:hypothetical protein